MTLEEQEETNIVALPNDDLAQAIERARGALIDDQDESGYWSYEFEADCTIPAEYILLAHFTGDEQFTTGVHPELEARIGRYLRTRQGDDGGWSQYPGGDFDLSCSVKAYYALKLVGDDENAPHMRRARELILRHGGAAQANVFTRITLALFEQVPWRAVPVVPVEIVLMPRWSPFSLSKAAYWTRTVTVPLAILCSRRERAKNPRGVGIRELFVVAPEEERNYFPIRSPLNRVFVEVDRVARKLERFIPNALRGWATRRAERWFVERLNGTDGLGAIFPAMVNAHEALVSLGYPADDPRVRESAQALKDLLIVGDEEAYCQPCVSPIWDTGLACLALHELDTGGAWSAPSQAATIAGLDWLAERQLTDEPGDWRERRPNLAGGGWPFQFGNGHYPDIDDTAVVAWAMHVVEAERYATCVERAAVWVAGMQSSNGGFGAFDVDNTYYYLNEIPFADHGALLDPPTADVTARCIAFLSRYDPKRFAAAIERGVGFLRQEQEPEGCWFGRWGTNYIYGTWSVLVALSSCASDADRPMIQRAVDWLYSVQRDDGGWGESNDSYDDPSQKGRAVRSTTFHTAWALLALMAAGELSSSAIRRGVRYLQQTQRADGMWWDDDFTCPGFPRVFYLKYHGYSRYFPLWALGRYQALSAQAA